jgi:hypothetical protein
MESAQQSPKQTPLSYEEWINNQPPKTHQNAQSRTGVVAMATTAGVGGVRIYDVIMARQQKQQEKTTLIESIEAAKKTTHRDVAAQTEHYDEQTEYLLQAQRDQEKDNESGDHMRFVPHMWSVGFI